MAEVTCGILRFDGTDDKVTFPDNAAYDVSAAMSWHFWYMRDYADSDTSTLIHRASTITVAHTATKQLKVTVSGVTAVTFKQSFERQVWHAVGIVIYEVGANMVFDLYYNGVLSDRQGVETAAFPAANANAFILGNNASTSWFTGRMTNVVSTSDELTKAEIEAIYALGRGTQDVALFDGDMICAPFNDGSGTTVDNDGLAGVDGTIAGTELWMVGPGIHLAADNGIIMAADQNDNYYGPLWISTLEWQSPTTATTHKILVTDWSGAELMALTCAVALDGGGQKVLNKRVLGLKIPDLDSGKLLITLE